MAEGALSIKLRCASWHQLATIYKRFEPQHDVPASGDTAARRDRRAHRSHAAQRHGDRARGHGGQPRPGPAARQRRRDLAVADPRQLDLADRERAGVGEQAARHPDPRRADHRRSPDHRRDPDDPGDQRARRGDRRRAGPDQGAQLGGRVAQEAEPVPRARRRLRGRRRRGPRRVRRAHQALPPGSLRALRVGRPAAGRSRDLHPDPRRVSQARRHRRRAQVLQLAGAERGRPARGVPAPRAQSPSVPPPGQPARAVAARMLAAGGAAAPGATRDRAGAGRRWRPQRRR